MTTYLPEPSNIVSLVDYTQYIESAYKTLTESNADDILLFRGQAVDEPLLPKMARLHLQQKKYDISQRRTIHETEEHMLSEFKRYARPFISVMPDTEWDWLALAQHHGMETRLLDWTTNPLVALYFALSPPRATNRVVWIFRGKEEDVVTPEYAVHPLMIKRTQFFRPSLLSPRIIAQDGWFSAHKYMTSKDAFIPMDNNRSYKNRLRKLSVHGRELDILSQLNLCGINESSLFPGLDGLSRHLNWKRVPDNWVHIRPTRVAE